MAWPWLAVVARNIPWTELARRAPLIIAASSELLDKRRAAARAPMQDPPNEADEIELARRIRALEEQDAEDARAIQQLAKDVSELQEGIQVLAARVRLLMWIAGGAALLALVACWWAAV